MIGARLAAHWYDVTCALLAILGACFIGYGYSDATRLRRLRSIALGFVYSLAGGFITLSPVAIVLFSFLILELFLVLIVNIFVPGTLAAAHFPQATLATLSLTIMGLLFGLLIGFPVGVRAGLIQRPRGPSQTVFSFKNILLFLLGIIYCLLLLFVEILFGVRTITFRGILRIQHECGRLTNMSMAISMEKSLIRI
jgi:hypothetical protein